MDISDGAEHLGAALTNNHSLTELNISINTIGDTGAAALGDALGNNKALITLVMVGCRIFSEGCAALAAGLSYPQYYKLYSNDVGVEGAVALGEALAHNKTLKILNLCGDESLQEEGVNSLIASLISNTTLQQLWLTCRSQIGVVVIR